MQAPTVEETELMKCERLKYYPSRCQEKKKKKSIPWHPGREPEHVHANDSVKRHHRHNR